MLAPNRLAAVAMPARLARLPPLPARCGSERRGAVVRTGGTPTMAHPMGDSLDQAAWGLAEAATARRASSWSAAAECQAPLATETEPLAGWRSRWVLPASASPAAQASGQAYSRAFGMR